MEWKYDDKIIDVVDSYVYLGLKMYINGRFNQTQKCLSEQGLRAMYNMVHNLKGNMISIDKHCEIFDAMISPIVLYASEVVSCQ